MEETFHSARQILRETFVKDQTELVTTDEELQQFLDKLDFVEQSTMQLAKLFSRYTKQLNQARTAQVAMSTFLQENGIRSADATGPVMTSLAGALKVSQPLPPRAYGRVLTSYV